MKFPNKKSYAARFREIATSMGKIYNRDILKHGGNKSDCIKKLPPYPYLTDGYSNPTADIFIDGKSIRGIYRCGTQSCEDAECYDLNGKTVLPGYFDLHAHLMFTNQNWEYLMHRNESAYVMDSAAYAKTYLKLGYTTIRDAGNDYYASVTVRDNINRGVLTGARVITSGKILTPTTRGNSSFGTLYKEIDGAEAMLKACREECAAGVDFIKYMCTGAMLNLGGVPGQIVTTPEELRAIVARRKDLEPRSPHIATARLVSKSQQQHCP